MERLRLVVGTVVSGSDSTCAFLFFGKMSPRERQRLAHRVMHQGIPAEVAHDMDQVVYFKFPGYAASSSLHSAEAPRSMPVRPRNPTRVPFRLIMMILWPMKPQTTFPIPKALGLTVKRTKGA